VLCVVHLISDYYSPAYTSYKYRFDIGPSSKDEDKLDLLKKLLADYRIGGFVKKSNYVFFEDELLSFEFYNPVVKIVHKKQEQISRTNSYYFPAERIALPMINESLFELTYAQSSLPAYFLEFGKDFTVSRKNQEKFNIPILNLDFEHREGRNFIVFDDLKSLLLEEASSAIQANLPLIIILQYPEKLVSMFVIEELELHGYPLLQKQLLYHVIERMRQPNLASAYVMLPTHSPYILSAANNLLFAAQITKQSEADMKKVNKIISKASWIENDEFEAYYLENGVSRSIVNNQTGLIDENELDGISEDLAGEFDALMDLYKPATV
jgi:hypothetical protein